MCHKYIPSCAFANETVSKNPFSCIQMYMYCVQHACDVFFFFAWLKLFIALTTFTSFKPSLTKSAGYLYAHTCTCTWKIWIYTSVVCTGYKYLPCTLPFFFLTIHIIYLLWCSVSLVAMSLITYIINNFIYVLVLVYTSYDLVCLALSHAITTNKISSDKCHRQCRWN